ncbi:MAG: tRNA (adenosine(37)-N6)-dimethylallyltransferase MiaA [Actinomycetota bacterium]
MSQEGPPEPLLALVGPTASGKTEAALEIAQRMGCEIVSADSMVVYRRMDVGTAKPTPSDRARVSHHLVDVADPSAPFSVAQYQALALAEIGFIERRGVRPLIVGGSGLYVRAVVDELDFPGTDPRTRRDLETEALLAGGSARLYERLSELDPVAAGKIEPENARRTVRALEVAAITGRPFSSYATAWEDYPAERVRAAGLEVPREVLAERIDRRVRAMVEEHEFLEEVRDLVEDGFGVWLTATQAIGYAEMARHLEGELSLEEAVAATVKRTKALARRQVAWFRRDPRIRWFPAPEGAAAITDELTEYLSD